MLETQNKGIRDTAPCPSLDRPVTLSVTVNDAIRLTGLGKTKLFELIADGTLETTLIGRRRLILFRSLRPQDSVSRRWRSHPDRQQRAADSAGRALHGHRGIHDRRRSDHRPVLRLAGRGGGAGGRGCVRFRNRPHQAYPIRHTIDRQLRCACRLRPGPRARCLDTADPAGRPLIRQSHFASRNVRVGWFCFFRSEIDFDISPARTIRPVHGCRRGCRIRPPYRAGAAWRSVFQRRSAPC